MSEKKDEALKLALENICAAKLCEFNSMSSRHEMIRLMDAAIAAIREALADSALDRMAENARELGLDYEPPCKTGSQCTSKCQQCEQPAQQDMPKIGCVNHDCDKCKAQQQEPVGAVYRYGKDSSGKPWHGVRWTASGLDLPDGTLIYTSPQSSKPLTDDPLQGAVDWLLEADGEYFCTATVQRTLRIGYNRAKRLCDTAKERAAHGIKGDE